MRLLDSSPLSNQNIYNNGAGLLCHTYTVVENNELYIEVAVNQVSGNGSYFAWITHDLLGVGTFYEVSPRTTANVPSGTTSIEFITIPVAVLATDVIKVYVLGLSSDTATPDIFTRVLEPDYLRPVTPGQHNASIDSGGNITVLVSLAQVALALGVSVPGSLITLRRGDTFVPTLTGLGVLTGYTSLWMTAKSVNSQQTDAQSLFQLKKNSSGSGDGLIYSHGGTAADATKGSIAVNDAVTGSITPTIDESITVNWEPGDYKYDVQMLNGGTVTTLTEGILQVVADITQALT